MKIPKLTPRLKKIYDIVPPCKTVCDIGTDHAYIPVCLTLSGKCDKAIASDIVKGPVERAKSTVLLYGAEDKVSVRLGGGLETVSEGEAETVIVAGMGGLTIAGILEKVADGLKTHKPRLILQPMTEQDKLRRTLFSLGYRIVCEKCPEASGKIYNVIYAEYGEAESYDEHEYVLGKYLLCDDKESYVKKLDLTINALQIAVSKGAKSKEAFLLELIKYREGLSQWQR